METAEVKVCQNNRIRTASDIICDQSEDLSSGF